MALLPPTVIGPVSVLNSSIRVQGQNIGASVELFASGISSPIGGGTAVLSNQVFPLNPGVQLAPGQTITATQSMNGETSPASPAAVTVQSKPSTVGAVGCSTHIYQCGQSLFLFGVVPGASVQVSVAGSLRGQGISADGTLSINLSEPILAGETVVVTQLAGGVSGPGLTLQQPDNVPVAAGGQLPPPTLLTPVYACQSAFQISNVVDGALVTLTETPGSSSSRLFAGPNGILDGDPLTAGGTVTVQQTMLTGCQISGTQSAPVTVTPTAPVPPPKIGGPIFVGGHHIELTNLIPGAQVEIFQGSESLGTATCFGAAQFFAVPALARKKLVQATQQLCGNVSGGSSELKPGAAPALTRPKVQKSLFQCGSTVGVTNLQVGATVLVYSTALGAPIGIAQVTSADMDIQVAPLLNAGDQIFARQQLANEQSKASKSITVAPLPNQGMPAIVAPVGVGSSNVFVQNMVIGARADVYVNNVFRGSALATAQSVQVNLSAPLLNLGDVVSVVETTCEGSLTGASITVAGCQCTQVSKAPTFTKGLFLYTFNCNTPIGTVETVQLTATDDISALQQAELGCDSEYGA